jgi:hypothetical protein
MKLARFFRKSDFFCLLIILLTYSGHSFAATGGSDYVVAQPQDTM